MTITKNPRLAIEFFLLCIALPTTIIVFKLAPFMFVFLWSAAGYCFLVYRKDIIARYREFWKWEAVTWQAMKPILIRWVLCCIGMTVFIYFYDPERMFGLWERAPQFVFILFLAYPILSAFPQEFIFCSFFFKRYDAFFTTERAKIIASAIVFATLI